MKSSPSIWPATSLALLLAAPAAAAVIPPAGYIYSPQLLGSLTQSCIAVGPGGTFVAIGPGFSANAQAVVFVKESGTARLVAFGFNSVGDCVYDAANDALYVSDNGGPGDLPGALTGDTVFRVSSASTASGLAAVGLELVPANSVPAASSLAIDASANVYVADSAGNGNGEVTKITMPAASPAPFATGFDLTAGLAFDAGGDLFVAETRSGTFDAQISSVDAAGVSNGVFAGPSFGFGSYDLAFGTDGRLLATGAFGGNVVSFDGLGAPTPFASGLTFATGISVNSFTGRVEILSSTFIPTDEDRSLHRFTPVADLVPGKGAARTECLHEFYGAKLVPPSPSKPATQALCTDGAACDADGTVNDRCVFPVGFCLGVDDVRFPTCDPAAVDSLTIAIKPDFLGSSAAIAAAKASLPVTGPACFFSDGVTVPVKIVAAGKRPGLGKVLVKAKSGTSVDADSLALVCEPAP